MQKLKVLAEASQDSATFREIAENLGASFLKTISAVMRYLSEFYTEWAPWQIAVLCVIAILPWPWLHQRVSYPVVTFSLKGILKQYLLTSPIALATFTSIVYLTGMQHPGWYFFTAIVMIVLQAQIGRSTSQASKSFSWSRAIIFFAAVCALPAAPCFHELWKRGKDERIAQAKAEAVRQERIDRLKSLFKKNNKQPITLANGQKVWVSDWLSTRWYQDVGASKNRWVAVVRVGSPLQFLGYTTETFSTLGTPTAGEANDAKGVFTIFWTQELPEQGKNENGLPPMVLLEDVIEGIPHEHPELQKLLRQEEASNSP